MTQAERQITSGSLVSRAIGKAKLYKIDKSNPMIKTITEFERKLSMQIAELPNKR